MYFITKLLKFNATYFDNTHESKVLTSSVNALREVMSIGLDRSIYTFEVLDELTTTPSPFGVSPSSDVSEQGEVPPLVVILLRGSSPVWIYPNRGGPP